MLGREAVIRGKKQKEARKECGTTQQSSEDVDTP